MDLEVRAYNYYDKQFYYPREFSYIDKEFLPQVQFKVGEEVVTTSLFDVYTGFKDKYKNKIYEHDRVTVIVGRDRKVEGEVKFFDGCWNIVFDAQLVIQRRGKLYTMHHDYLKGYAQIITHGHVIMKTREVKVA